MQLPYLDSFENVRYANAAAQTAGFRAGEVDQYYPPDFKTWLTVMQSNPESITQVVEGPAIAQYHVALRLDKPPFNDIRVRQALSQLIDREALTKNLFSGMAAYSYPQDWSYWGYKWGWKAEQLGKNATYDPANAKKLLTAAGWDPKFVVEMYFGTSTSGIGFNIYQAVAGMWEAEGVKTNITTTADPAASNKVIVDRSYPGVMPYFVFPPGIDPDNYTYLIMHSKAPQNIYYINDPKIDQWCIDQRRALEKPARQKILTDLMTYDLEQTTRISLVNPYKINLRKPNLFSITDNIDYWSVFGWGPISTDLAWKSS
jgi:ABC-type transport system substrate-binding protein